MNYYQLDNDVLSIISSYVGFPIKYVKNKLIIRTNNNCESCNNRMRRTNKSMIEAYSFPKLWEIDQEFYNEQSKYIKPDNTLILHENIYMPYNQAYENGLISYSRNRQSRGYFDNSSINVLYGSRVLPEIDNIKIYVKKAPSLKIMYRALKNTMGGLSENEFLKKLKEYDKEGFDKTIMNRCIKTINITDLPIKMVVRLCSKCREKVKKGYIFT